MIVVKTYAEVQELKAAVALPESFWGYVEREWIDLHKAFSDKGEMSEFSLVPNVYQVCLEPRDKLPEDLSWPEYVERIRLGDCEMFRMYVMEVEDTGILYYAVVGTLDNESERFLRECTEMNER